MRYIGILLLILLVGCGTFNERVKPVSEGSSAVGEEFAAVKYDIKEATNPWSAIFSLGIIPVFYTVSMPIDLGFDLLFYPGDKYANYRFRKKITVAQKPFQFIRVAGINLTPNSDFDFKATLQEKVPYYQQRMLRAYSQDGSRPYWPVLALRKNNLNKVEVNWTIDKSRRYLRDNPHKDYTDEWYEWRRKNKKENTFKHHVELAVSSIAEEDSESFVLVFVFLPCDQIITVVEPFHDIKRLQQVTKLKQSADYQRLSELEKLNSCPIASHH